MAGTFSSTSDYMFTDAVSWTLHGISLYEYLSDLAECDIREDYPEETRNLSATSTDIKLYGDSGHQEVLQFWVTIRFGEE